MSLLSKKKGLIKLVDAVQPGVVLTFDDYTRVSTWVNYHNTYGEAKGWKATFFINQSDSTISNLQYLYSKGHAIENHSTYHYNGVNNYMLNGTAAGYYNTYLKPLDDWIKANGMPQPSCFRYPYNYTNQEVTAYLLDNNIYKIISPGIGIYGTSQLIRTYDCVYDYDNYPEALSIDRYIPDYSVQTIMDVLAYAKNNNKIVMFYGHSIGNQGIFQSVTDISLLNAICDYVNENGMRFYLASELADLQGVSTSVKCTAIGTFDDATDNGGSYTFTATILGQDKETPNADLTWELYDGTTLLHTFGSANTDGNVTITNNTLTLVFPLASGTYNFDLKGIDADNAVMIFNNALDIQI